MSAPGGRGDRLQRERPWLRTFRSPLLRNGYALALSTGSTAVLGMVFWLLAARLYDRSTVGVNTTLITLMILVGGVGELGMHTAMPRFLPRTGRLTGRFVALGYLAVIGVALPLGGAVALLLLPRLGATALNDLPPGAGLWFALAVALWSSYLVQDGVLAGLRHAPWVPITNVAGALVKIALLVLLARVLPAQGIFVAWMIALALVAVPTTLLIFRRFIPANAAGAQGADPPLPLVATLRYVAGNYMGALFLLASLHLMPVIVFVQLGPLASASFYVPWMISNSLQLFAANMATSLTVEAVRDTAQLWRFTRAGLLAVAGLLGPLVLGIVVCAGPLLGLFGRAYAESGAPLLQLLALSSLPYAVTALYLGIARAQGRPAMIALVQSLLCGLAVGLSALALPRLGIVGVGAVYLAVQSLMALSLALTAMRAAFVPRPR